jgi:hypothetical protein
VGDSEASPTKCGKNIVVACWANDRQTKVAGSGIQACVCTVMVGLTDHATSDDRLVIGG